MIQGENAGLDQVFILKPGESESITIALRRLSMDSFADPGTYTLSFTYRSDSYSDVAWSATGRTQFEVLEIAPERIAQRLPVHVPQDDAREYAVGIWKLKGDQNDFALFQVLQSPDFTDIHFLFLLKAFPCEIDFIVAGEYEAKGYIDGYMSIAYRREDAPAVLHLMTTESPFPGKPKHATIGRNGQLIPADHKDDEVPDEK